MSAKKQKAKYKVIKNYGHYAVVMFPNEYFGVIDQSIKQGMQVIAAGMKRHVAEEFAEQKEKRFKGEI